MTGNSDGLANGTKAAPKAHKPYGKHFQWTLEHHRRLRYLTEGPAADYVVTVHGDGLTMADIVAISQKKARCRLTTEEPVLQRVDASVDFLAQQLESGSALYGINTGFGGSADTRTSHTVDLQKALLQTLSSGILIPSDTGNDASAESETVMSLNKHCLPRTVVRGAMLARCNSLMRGHSAVRRSVIETLLALLNLDYIPVVPLRGSISASGDLMPLAYIASALEGNPGIHISCPLGDRRVILPANEALHRAGISPVTLGPKEGLGIANGTVVSGTVAILGVHEAQYLALFTQALTGMATEAMRGSIDNHDPFIAAARPHPGQVEAAANITRFLQGSDLATSHGSGAKMDGLAQDRYALRTASQWLAPYLEDLELAARQLETELNSTTDNPLIDVQAGRVHHGGNFQATSVTSATEKTRLALQMFGKLIFAQASEIINPMMNGNLPPNLSFDDPSLSFTFKGLDINMAAYMSELGFLANPVSSHVQSAEMNNQAVNSLALISARYTLDAVEIVSMMVAVHLYACCQALDLQTVYSKYMAFIKAGAFQALLDVFGSLLNGNELDEVVEAVMKAICSGLKEAKTKDLRQQAVVAADATVTPIFSLAFRGDKSHEVKSQLISAVLTWKEQCVNLIISSISHARSEFATGATTITSAYLSRGSKILYNFVRNELKVPLHKGLVEHATCDRPSPEGNQVLPEDRALIGKQVSIIYEAVRSGRVHDALIESLL